MLASQSAAAPLSGRADAPSGAVARRFYLTLACAAALLPESQEAGVS